MANLHPGLKFLVRNLHALVTVKLDGTNFILWRTQVLNVFRANNLLQYLDPTTSPPEMIIREANGELVSNPEYDEWLIINNHLLSCLTATLSQAVLPYVLNMNRVIDVWTALERRFSSFSRSHVHQLKKKLHDITKGTDSMEDYLKTVKTIADNLASSNSIIADEDLVLFILNGLPPEYNALATYVRARPTPISVEELNDLLISEEIHVLKQSSSVVHGSPSDFNPAQPALALQATTAQAPRGNYYYRGRGNFRGNRNFRGGYRRRSEPRATCQICGRQNHVAFECYHRMDPRFQPSSSRGPQPQALIASQTNVPNQPWYFDSGATNHITSDLSNLSVHDNYNGQDSVSVGNGSTMSINHTALDKYSKRILFQGPSRNGLYPISPHKPKSVQPQALSVKVSAAVWHYRACTRVCSCVLLSCAYFRIYPEVVHGPPNMKLGKMNDEAAPLMNQHLPGHIN